MKNMRKVRKALVRDAAGKYAIIYIRVSDPHQIEGTSLEEQERQCRKYCEDKGLKVLQVFREEGHTAKTLDNREALVAAIEFCRKSKGKVNAFVVWKVDRFARKVSDHYGVKGQLKKYGVKLYSATEQIGGETATDKIAEVIYAGFAEFDNDIRAMRAVNGMRARIRSGIWPFKAPVGYRNMKLRDQGKKKTEPDPIDPLVFPILQRVLKGFANGTFSQKEIVEELQKANFEALSGIKANLQFVDRFLTEENLYFYAGILRDAFGDEYEFHPGRHKPMITEDEMKAIVLIRNKGSRVRIARDRYNPEFPLRRIVNCSMCGRPLTGSAPKGRKARYAYYHCYNKGCPMAGKGIAKDDVESKFKTLMSGLLPHSKFLAFLREALCKHWQDQIVGYETAQEAQKASLAVLKAKKAKVYEMAEGDAYTPTEVRERLESINSDIVELELGLANMAIERMDPDTMSDCAKKALDHVFEHILTIDPAIRYRFQKLAFPDGISFCRESGFGTAKTARIFELNREFIGAHSLSVRRGGFEPP